MLMRRAMGYLPKIGSNGAVVDCDQFSNLLQSVCWDPFAPTVPVTVGTDVSGNSVLTPDVSAAASNLNQLSCSMFQSPNADGTCGTDWTTVAIAGAVGLALALVIGRAL